MAHKTLAITVLCFFGLSLFEGLFLPNHVEANENERVHDKGKKGNPDGKSLDWVDKLAEAIAQKKEWDEDAAKRIIEESIKKDEVAIKKLEEQIKAAASGITGAVANGIDKATLAALKVQLGYHKKIQKVINELHENKRDRVHVVRHLIDLDKNNKKMAKLEHEYTEAQGSEKVKLWPSVNLQRLKVEGKKKYIEARILKSAIGF